MTTRSLKHRAPLTIELDQEDDGRWIGEVTQLPGVLVYGATKAETRNKAVALALRVIADRIEAGEPLPFDPADLFAAA
jgi:predicted RNase H-like HicB family nuclease